MRYMQAMLRASLEPSVVSLHGPQLVDDIVPAPCVEFACATAPVALPMAVLGGMLAPRDVVLNVQVGSFHRRLQHARAGAASRPCVVVLGMSRSCETINEVWEGGPALCPGKP